MRIRRIVSMQFLQSPRSWHCPHRHALAAGQLRLWLLPRSAPRGNLGKRRGTSSSRCLAPTTVNERTPPPRVRIEGSQIRHRPHWTYSRTGSVPFRLDPVADPGSPQVRVDYDSAVIAWAPRFRRVKRAYLDTVRYGSRGKHEIELPGCRCRVLSRVVKGRHAEAVARKLAWPRVRLASVGVLGPTNHRPRAWARSNTVS